jgi:signal transduction histidine kinase
MHAPSAAIDRQRQVSQPASLLVVNSVAAALLSGDPAEALEALRREGIDATVSDGALKLRTALDPELAAALTNLFALALRREEDLLPSGRHATIGELAGEIGHEINNPLFAILGLVELLAKDAEPGTKTHERLLLVEQTGGEIKELVRALLKFVREPTDEIRPIVLQDLVAQALDFVRRTSASKDVEIVERLDPTPVRVEGNPNQLKQVRVNLLTNARQVLPEGGTITVSLAADRSWATMRVSDTGPGIGSDVRKRIFEPFFTTKDERGTGLGLPVSRTIARLHGGSLDLDEAGEGATFVFRLPVAPMETE